jgi:hypothetical protein
MLTHRQALEVIAAVRGEQVVITTMGSMGLWPELSDTPLDFAYVPSSMGQGIPLGLGLALAQPSRGVIAIIGDGSLLMNLGALVTVTSHPAPLHVVLIDNGVYEVTGGQPTPGSGQTDFAGLATAAGIERVFQFDALPEWANGAAEALGGTDPSFVWLRVDRQTGSPPPPPSRTMAEQISRLREALGLAAGPADAAGVAAATLRDACRMAASCPGSLLLNRLNRIVALEAMRRDGENRADPHRHRGVLAHFCLFPESPHGEEESLDGEAETRGKKEAVEEEGWPAGHLCVDSIFAGRWS